MKDIAFLVLAHTDPRQLGRLCDRLIEVGDVYIHIDAKYELSSFKETCSKECIFVTDRIEVSWGSYAQTAATVNLMRAAVDANIPYKYCSLMSGLDYPIKPLSRYRDHLLKLFPMEFINTCRMYDSPEHYAPLLLRLQFKTPMIGRGLLDKVFRKILNIALYKYRRRYYLDYIPHFGSAYWSLTIECVKHILNELDLNRKIEEYYKYTMASDEQVFHTIVLNSAFGINAPAPVYYGRGTAKYSNHHFFHPSHKVIFDDSHFPLIESCGEKYFFARKITSTASLELIARIDALLLR